MAAPFPEMRIKYSPSFTITGVDFTDPLYCADNPSKKYYILLFTCAVVRAIQIELTESMTVKDCTLAIRRFTSRRGIPSFFFSDNAKTFVAMEGEMPKI